MANTWTEVVPKLLAQGLMALREQIVLPQLVNRAYDALAGQRGSTIDVPIPSAITNARKTLHEQLAPFDDRFCVIDPDAEANALNLRAFQDASYRGDTAGIVAGLIGKKLGSDWVMSQHVPTHTAGTGESYVVNKAEGYAAGATTIEVDGGSGTMLVGDIVTFAGHDQPYVVAAALASDQLRIAPGLQAAVADDAAVTLKATHVVNLVFHRDAIAFATRPLEGTVRPGLGSVVETAVDPESGLALRLEVTRQHKQTRYAYDILWGAALVRPELAVRLAG